MIKSQDTPWSIVTYSKDPYYRSRGIYVGKGSTPQEAVEELHKKLYRGFRVLAVFCGIQPELIGDEHREAPLSPRYLAYYKENFSLTGEETRFTVVGYLKKDNNEDNQRFIEFVSADCPRQAMIRTARLMATRNGTNSNVRFVSVLLGRQVDLFFEEDEGKELELGEYEYSE